MVKVVELGVLLGWVVGIGVYLIGCLFFVFSLLLEEKNRSSFFYEICLRLSEK